MKQFIITEEERKRILGIHEQRTSRHYLMEKPIESDSVRIIESVLNEKRMSATELIKDMTLRDVVDVVNSFSSKQISVKEVKEKIEYMFRPSGGRMNEEIIEQNDNSLHSDIMDLIHNSNSSHEETIDVLNSIVDEMSSSKRMRRNVERRFRDEM